MKCTLTIYKIDSILLAIASQLHDDVLNDACVFYKLLYLFTCQPKTVHAKHFKIIQSFPNKSTSSNSNICFYFPCFSARFEGCPSLGCAQAKKYS